MALILGLPPTLVFIAVGFLTGCAILAGIVLLMWPFTIGNKQEDGHLVYQPDHEPEPSMDALLASMDWDW